MATTKTVTTTKAPTLTQKYKQLSEVLDSVENDRERLSEALANAVSLLRQEDIGWAMPGEESGDPLTYRGLSLASMQRWSTQIRASLTGTQTKAPNPHMRNGLMLRHSFIWSGGIHYGNIPGDGEVGGKRGKANVQNLIDAIDNQRHFFGSTARRKREHALYSDGLYLVVGEDKSKKLRPVPLHEITDTMRSDLYQDEIIAYRWSRNEIVTNKDKTVTRELVHHWVYVDWYDEVRPDKINYSGQIEDVMKGHTAFDLHANRPDGHAFGSPDAISALVWARTIRDLIMNGVKMQDALAMFTFKAISPSKAGQQTTALELAKSTPAGSSVALGGENDLVPLSSAGKGYDFGSIGFVVATMAASLHVSGIALSANTALAGSSYGAAKTLDLPGQMAMETRRAEHIEFDERVLRWLGAPDAEIFFDTYDDATDQYRAMQAAVLAWTTGNLTPEGFRDELEVIYGHKLTGDIPDGVIIPNNQKQVDAANAATAAAAAVAAADKAASPTPSTPAPGQGKSDATGGAGHAADMKAKTK